MKQTFIHNSIMGLTAGLALIACTPEKPSTSYTLTGTVGEGVEDGRVIIMKDETGQPVAAPDTVRGGVFSFSGQADSVMLVRISAGNRKTTYLVLEPGDIHVDLATGDATGTPLNDELQAASDSFKSMPDSLLTDSLERAILSETFDRHKNDILGLFFMQDLSYYLTYDELAVAIDTGSQYLKGSESLASRLESKRIQKATAPGNPYIDVKGVDAVSGDSIALSRWVGNGKLTLVDFWASWCGPCRREIPFIAENVKKYGKQINVVGLAVWDKLPDTQTAMSELNITWPILSSSNAATLYGVIGIPHIMLIAPDGTILARDLRGKGIGEAIEKALANLPQ